MNWQEALTPEEAEDFSMLSALIAANRKANREFSRQRRTIYLRAKKRASRAQLGVDKVPEDA